MQQYRYTAQSLAGLEARLPFRYLPRLRIVWFHKKSIRAGSQWSSPLMSRIRRVVPEEKKTDIITNIPPCLVEFRLRRPLDSLTIDETVCSLLAVALSHSLACKFRFIISSSRKKKRTFIFTMPFADINGHLLHYTDIAPSSASSATNSSHPLLFIHGLGSTQNYYFPIFPYLTSYRCIIFDNYGAGRSKYVEGDTSIPSIAADALALLDHLSIPSAVVVGYSMGGMVPTYLASTSPDRVLAGICIGPVHPSPAVADVFRQRIPTVREGGMETMANAIPNSATGKRATALQKGFIREMLLAQEPDGYIANCRAIELATPPEYAQVKCPVLIVAGDEDKSAPLAGCEKIFSELGTEKSKKRLEVLTGVGHWHCVEAPDKAGVLIKEFCQQL